MLLARSTIRALQRPLDVILRVRHSSFISWTRSSHNPILPAIPELFNPNFLDELLPPTNTPTKSDGSPRVDRNPMMDALCEFSHRTLTENNAPAYDSTLSATLDAFQKLTPYSFGGIGKLLDKAWSEDPDLTLKIIWNLRSIHDGKAEREAFYRAFGWLYDNHPRTAITNLHFLVDQVCLQPGKDNSCHGYYKDLLNIVALATVDELSNIEKPASFLHNRAPRKPKKDSKETQPTKAQLKPLVKARRVILAVTNHLRLERKLTDPKYRALYVAVARLFAERIMADFRLSIDCNTAENAEARAALLRQISLAPKWAPTLRGSHDRHTNIATAISRLLYHAKDSLPLRFPSALKDHPALDAPEPTDILRSFYRRWFITPLRAATLVTETFMAAGRWTEIPYSRVSSLCMKNNTLNFHKHDPVGFEKYLVSVEKGHKTISGATLLPHELIAAVCALSNMDDDRFPELKKHKEALAAVQLRTLEAQWKALVQNLRAAGTLDNSIAVCDVSGSMGSVLTRNPTTTEPIFPAVALSLLLAQLATPPFNNGFITFSHNPQFVRLDPTQSLHATVAGMERTEWEMNTDINAVFLRLILPLAVKHNVAPADMIKRVFVFSDMQFDDAAEGGAVDAWETNYDVIERAFKAAGYEVPQIVYWNLSSYGTVEVLADRRGVAMMSGFSPSMLKVFMGEEAPAEAEESDVPVEIRVKEEFNPLNIMKKALSKESYAGLRVVD
ncbi:hypothetical protein DFH09DRAFT_1264765 [Mycena vulgaris]|nr:hypothetical protein DFH09DRAFT_1264765 [Mycena vulgaris]